MNDIDYYASVPETILVRDCIQYLEIIGCFVWRQNTGAAKYGKSFVRFGVKGISDIIGIAGRKFIAVECKRRGNKPTRDQAEFLERVRQEGGIGLLVYSVRDLEAQLGRL